MSDIWYLDHVDLFSILCPHKFGEFVKSHFLTYDKGAAIYFTDDRADSIFLIATGKVKISYYSEDGDEVVRGILSKGEMFGELALLGERRRRDIATAIIDGTVLCPVSIDQLHDLMKDNQELNFKIYKLIGLKLKKLERRIDNLVFKDVRTRLIDFILELLEERGVKRNDHWMVEHYYTHKNIANLIGTSRQTVTTTLNELKADGLLDFDRKKFFVLEREKMEAEVRSS
jgi:CRP-like cAMP-binding protein